MVFTQISKCFPKVVTFSLCSLGKLHVTWTQRWVRNSVLRRDRDRALAGLKWSCRFTAVISPAAPNSPFLSHPDGSGMLRAAFWLPVAYTHPFSARSPSGTAQQEVPVRGPGLFSLLSPPKWPGRLSDNFQWLLSDKFLFRHVGQA